MSGQLSNNRAGGLGGPTDGCPDDDGYECESTLDDLVINAAHDGAVDTMST